MTEAIYQLDVEQLTIPTAAAKEAAAPYAEAYQTAEPYNHICIDGFLPPAVCERVLEDIATLPTPERSFSRAQENLKSSFNPDDLPTYSRALFHSFNSRPFILFLEEMTGIKGLIADPYYIGAGIHRTENGGHLDIHADFNVHGQMKVERRLNVLIYLNRDWQESWGGSFEIWDKDMKAKEASFVPTFNRMVCFSTGSDTFHGNPEPVNHPDEEPRLSIALYYYTATWDESRKRHTTLFKPRPGSGDKTDRMVAFRSRAEDLTPPILWRRLSPLISRVFG
ncbi:MAG: 2OG-Fe(II) oxygenase [Pseudomonadota bacterium]